MHSLELASIERYRSKVSLLLAELEAGLSKKVMVKKFSCLIGDVAIRAFMRGMICGSILSALIAIAL